jgi:hypothetical protein
MQGNLKQFAQFAQNPSFLVVRQCLCKAGECSTSSTNFIPPFPQESYPEFVGTRMYFESPKS